MQIQHLLRGPLAGLLAFGVLTACDSDSPSDPGAGPIVFTVAFHDGPQGWEADFVDFPPDRNDDVGFVSDVRALPEPLDTDTDALYHEGLNLSDDLFMYHKRRVTGLEPGVDYRVRFSAEFATTVGRDCVAGLGLFLKAGAVPDEPVRVIGNQEGWVRLSADKGVQTDVGSEVVLLGEMRNDVEGCTGEFGTAELGEDTDALNVTADEDGAVWLYFGEESVFETAHSVYYLSFEARFEEI